MKTIAVAFCGAVLACVPAMAQPNKLSSADKAFLKTAAEANMKEAHVGQMAQDQGTENGVKELGQTLVKDHTAAYQELAAVADKAGEQIPKGIDVKKDKGIERLTNLKGKQFDKQFVQHEIMDHKQAIAEFKREAEHGQDPAVKAYASKTIPVLEGHLHQAEALAKSGNAGAKKG